MRFYFFLGIYVQEGIRWFFGDVEFIYIEGGCGYIIIFKWFIFGEEGLIIYMIVSLYICIVNIYLYLKFVIDLIFVINF